MDNYLARQRLEPLAATYAGSLYPKNTFADGPADRTGFARAMEAAIESLERRHLL